MEEQILSEIKKIEKIGIHNIDLLALVTDTSYEVVFYGIYNGERLQSNEMAEKGIIELDAVDSFYNKIAMIIRNGSSYDASKMNIIKCCNNGSIRISYNDKNCRVYRIKKEWKNSI